jgi:hypothetical protein
VSGCGGSDGEGENANRKIELKSAQSGPATGSEEAEPCGGGVFVNATTSCELARSVATAYRTGNGPAAVRVEDPASKTTHKLSCNRLTRVNEAPAVCGAGKTVIHIR